MKRSYLAFAFVAAALAAVPSTGCIVECEDGVCKATSTIEYTAQAQSQTAAYTSGQGIRIVGVNGRIQVRTGGSDVGVTFSPFTREVDDEDGKSKARNELENKLNLEVTEGDTIVVRVSRGSGSTTFLGAHIEVRVPSGFDGAFEVDQNNGSTDVNLGGTTPTSTKIVSGNGGVDVSGAAGPLTIVGENGSMNVSIASWADSGTGRIEAGNGSLTLTVPRSANGTLTLAPSGELDIAGMPAEFAKAENEGGAAFTMGDGTGAAVTAVTENGKITARAQ